jgi:hypothetical protein
VTRNQEAEDDSKGKPQAHAATRTPPSPATTAPVQSEITVARNLTMLHDFTARLAGDEVASELI